MNYPICISANSLLIYSQVAEHDQGDNDSDAGLPDDTDEPENEEEVSKVCLLTYLIVPFILYNLALVSAVEGSRDSSPQERFGRASHELAGEGRAAAAAKYDG